MRPSASSCQSSRYRLLTPLLVLLLGIYCAQTVGGSSRSASANLGVPDLPSSQLSGGTPLALNYHLISQCRAHVQIMSIRGRGRRAINAWGSASSKFAVLTFESHSPTELKILGVKSQMYMCFSKSGKLIGRYDGRSQLCLFREQEKGGYIMLQSVAQPLWYVGFNKRGRRKTGYSFSKTKKHANNSNSNGNGNGTSVNANAHAPHGPHPKRRGRQRQRQHGLNRHKQGRKRRPRWRVLQRRLRQRRLRGSRRVRQSRDRTMCFQFTLKRIDRDLSDPRVQNSLSKQIHDPWRDSDVSKFVSTPNPR